MNLKGHPVAETTLTLGLFGLFFGLSNWIIKNEDIQKQFKDAFDVRQDTFIEKNEVIFSNAVKSLFEKGDDKLPLRIYSLKEIMRLVNNHSIDKERINLVTGAGHDLSRIRLEGSIPVDFCLGKARLEKAEFVNVDSQGIDLRYAILSDATFYIFHLIQANLCYADCRRSKICSGSFINILWRETNFQEAIFDGVKVSGILQDIDFRGAVFRLADLTETRLSNVNFEGAKYSYSTFSPGFEPEKYGMVKVGPEKL